MGLLDRLKRRSNPGAPGSEPVLDLTAPSADPTIDLSSDPDFGPPDPLFAEPDPRGEFAALVEREWRRLAAPGTWWSAGERLAIVADARSAIDGEPLSGVLPPPVEEATSRIALRANGIRSHDVDQWETDGLDRLAYVEIVGIVSRVIALDTTNFGLGQPPAALPEPESGEPRRVTEPEAELTNAWVPTVGPAGAPSSLTAVPSEADALLDVRGVLYAPIDQMFDMRMERDGLTRPQIELVAARTSSLDDGFHCLLGHASMLRASIEANGGTLTTRAPVTGVGPTGVEHGNELIAFVDAVVLRDDEEYRTARPALEAAIGVAATDRAAMVAGSFSMMNRALDSIGAPIDPSFEALAAEMGVSVPEHLLPVGARSLG